MAVHYTCDGCGKDILKEESFTITVNGNKREMRFYVLPSLYEYELNICKKCVVKFICGISPKKGRKE